MARLNVYVPDELADSVRARLPELNVSAVLQRGLQSALECRHDRMACRDCATPIDKRQAIDEALGAFFVDVHWSLRELVERGGTSEGAARIFHEVAARHQITAAKNYAQPRPSRAQRHANKVVDWFDAQTA